MDWSALEHQIKDEHHDDRLQDVRRDRHKGIAVRFPDVADDRMVDQFRQSHG